MAYVEPMNHGTQECTDSTWLSTNDASTFETICNEYSEILRPHTDQILCTWEDVGKTSLMSRAVRTEIEPLYMMSVLPAHSEPDTAYAVHCTGLRHYPLTQKKDDVRLGLV
jgi:hypothetical protein